LGGNVDYVETVAWGLAVLIVAVVATYFVLLEPLFWSDWVGGYGVVSEVKRVGNDVSVDVRTFNGIEDMAVDLELWCCLEKEDLVEYERNVGKVSGTEYNAVVVRRVPDSRAEP
jgi:hypothetical protein